MKKLITLISLLLVCITVFSQFPQNPTQGGIQIKQTNEGALEGKRGIKGGQFVDTSSANLVPYMKGVAGILIYTTSDDNYWYRSYDTTKWVLTATTTSNCAGTQLISGSVTWSGAGLVYDATDLDYYIICTRYFANATTLTLSVADPTFARIDKFYADNTDHVGVITGTPSANPQEPQVNPLTQIDLGFVYVPAGSTIPAGTTQTIIYNENVEWTPTSDVSGIDFASTSSPCYQSLAVVSPTMDSAEYISFQNGSTLNINNQQYLKFRYKKLSSFSPVPSTGIVLSFYHGSTQISEEFTLVNGAYGYDETLVDSCQLIVIPLTGIVTSDSLFDKLYITNNGAVPTFQLDYIYLLEGASVPPVISSSWKLPGNAGINDATDYVGTSDAKKLNFGTNGQIRAYIDTAGITSTSDTSYKIVVQDSVTGKIWRIDMPFIFAGRGLVGVPVGANKIRLDNDSAVYIVTQINDTTLSFTHYDGRIDTVTIASSGGGGGSGSQTFPQTLAVGRTMSANDSVLLANKSFYFKDGKLLFDTLHSPRIPDTSVVRQKAYAYGTSVTEGYYSTVPWFTRFCSALNLTPVNLGVAGNYLMKRSPIQTLNVQDQIATTPMASKGSDGKYLIFEFLENDIVHAGISGTNYDTTNMKIDYNSLLDTAILKGWSYSDMVIVSSQWCDSTSVSYGGSITRQRQDDFFNATRNFAASKGVKFVDVYNPSYEYRDVWFYGKEGTTTDGSHLHPGNEGHSLLANIVLDKVGGLVVKNRGQQVAIAGLLDVESLRISGLDTSRTWDVPVTTDSSGKIHKGYYGQYIMNSPPDLQSGSIRLNGDAFVNTINGFGRFNRARFAYPNGGKSIEIHYDTSGSPVYSPGIYSFDQTAIAYTPLDVRSSYLGLNKGYSTLDNISATSIGIPTGYLSVGTGGVPQYSANAGPRFYAGIQTGAAYIGAQDWTSSFPYGTPYPLVLQYSGGGIKVGANSLPHASALIDMGGTSKGLLIPRMTSVQRAAISSPANGLLVFDTDSNSVFQYAVSVWQNLYNTGVGGSGTVTSVAMSVPSWLSVSGSPITTSGTLAVSAATGLTANQFLATPNGSTGAVSLRSIVAADIPTLNQNTTGSAGSVAAANITGLGTGVATLLAATPSGTTSLAGTASPTFTTQITSPKILGGTATTSSLTLQTTSGVGTTNADFIFLGGNNGASELMRITNAGIMTTLGNVTVGNNLFVSSGLRIGSASAMYWNGKGGFISPVNGISSVVSSAFTDFTGTLRTGGFQGNYVAKTSAYTATLSDYTIDCTSGTFTVTLPTAVGITGQVYAITNSGAGTITIATTSSQTFTNVTATPTTLTLATVGSVLVQSTGANWLQLK